MLLCLRLRLGTLVTAATRIQCIYRISILGLSTLDFSGTSRTALGTVDYSALMARHEEQWLELSEVVRQLRGQLNQAMADSKDDDVQFELGPVELEFEVAVSRERGTDGGLKVGVLSLGAKGSRSNGTKNRMKLTLTPQNQQGGPARISGTERKLPQG
ncbi:trypco2 family protein [Streptomyces xinghaiensis]|uniref:trypco2 family protein n=1 Tax=Streptomyces xinghaiensis TaxID=1038928 RepID=UPI002E12E3E4|nr:hypothetical protein OG463_01650 [Streptomyces xinghaiensis]